MSFPSSHKIGDAELAQKWISESPLWNYWTKIGLRSLVRITEFWENFLEHAEPSLIVTANQSGVEGWITHLARLRKIPVLQLMHGVLGGYFYTKTPIVSDAMVVFGEFWKGLWPKDQQTKIIAHVPSEYYPKITRKTGRTKKRLTFFSWPLHLLSFYNFFEFSKSIIHIFEKMLQNKDFEIMVRFHPAENSSDFINSWRHLIGNLPSNLFFSKQEPLDEILAQTDVALIFRSTIMLNCISCDIPIIMPGWIDFGWNDSLKNIAGIHLVESFKDMEKVAVQCLESPKAPNRNALDNILSDSNSGYKHFSKFINNAIGKR